MIYKFIDNNGSEITVNSISSLQALIDSETVKKDTKVKAGLRGKWTTAKNIPELVFEEKKEEITEETIEPEEDIKTFISKQEIKDEPKEEIKIEKTEEIKEKPIEEQIENAKTENVEEKADYDLVEEKKDKTYDDENVIGLNFFQAIGICLRKYFTFKGRASRSEYWFFQLLLTPISLPLIFF